MPDCAICLEPFAEADLSSTSCGHVLHSKWYARSFTACSSLMVSLRRSMRVRRDCPICRQPVHGVIRIYLNLDPSLSQAQPARPTIVPPTLTEAAPTPSALAALVVDLVSEDESSGEPISTLSSDSSEYPDLDRIRYSDIEPDLAEVDELQDALARAALELRASLLESQRLQDRLASAERHIDARQAIITELERHLTTTTGRLEQEQREHGRTERRLVLEQGRAEGLEREAEALRAENSSLMMRKVAADIERILMDLTLEQAVEFGADIDGLPREQVALRMAALVRAGKMDRMQCQETERQLRVRTSECEQQLRRAKRAEEELAQHREELTQLREDYKQLQEAVPMAPIEPVQKKVKVLQEDFTLPVSKASRPFASIKAPSKFSTARSAFEKPDGTGGSSKRPFF